VPAVDYNPFVRNRCKREIVLENVFGSFNKIYFHGRLPQYRVLVCSRSRWFSHLSAGYCSSEDQKIFLRSGISLNTTLQTLMHEMIHAKLWWVTKNVHGPAFINELKRVRRLGAPLSSSELDLTNENMFVLSRLTRQNVENSIRYALEKENLPSKLVPKFLELEFNLSYSVIRRQIPSVSGMIAQILGSSGHGRGRAVSHRGRHFSRNSGRELMT
jgi:hypothetical protein